MKNIFNVIKSPVITEKTSIAKELSNTIVFEVARDATKTQIKNAVQQLFAVKVKSVNTLIQRGKVKRMGRSVGTRNNYKRAYVQFESGTDLDVFGVVQAPMVEENKE